MFGSQKEEPTNRDTTVMVIGLPADVSLPRRNELIANLLDTANKLNQSAGGSELEIGEILDVNESDGSVKKVVLHGDIRHPALKMPKFDDTSE